jgi:hypothetical protein
MADKETGLNIPVSAVADKNSAKEAVNELTKDVLSSLKDGYIEIPAELKVPIKGASKDLAKAQKDVIQQWERTFREGFSSSAKDLDALTEAYQRFKKLTGQQHKAGTKQSKGISAIMGDQIQAYSISKKDVQARRTEFKKQIEKAQKRGTKQGMTSDEKKLLKEEIDHAIAQEYKRKGYGKLSKDLGRGASRAKAATPGSPINLGLRSPAMGGPYVSEHTLRMSELSPYRNIDEVRRAKEQQEIRRVERASLTSRRATTEEIESSKQRAKQREAAGRSQSGTEYELIKKALLTELAKIQGGLIKGRPDATSQKLIDQVLANLTYDEQKGVDPLKSIMGIHNMLQKRYDTKGSIGITDGSVKGEGPNQKEANETLTQIYKILGQFIDTRRAIVDNVSAIKSTLLSGNTSRNGSAYEQTLAKIQNSEQMKSMKESLNPIGSKIDATNRFVKIGNTKEAVDNGNEQKISRENKDINRDTAKAVKIDVKTGFNTDAKADELIGLVRSILQQLQHVIPSQSTSSKSTMETRSLGELRDVFKNAGLTRDQIEQKLAYISNIRKGKVDKPNNSITNGPTPPIGLTGEIEPYQNKVQKSNIYASPFRQGPFKALNDAFLKLTKVTRGYAKILNANADEQDRIAAERIETWGLSNGRNPNDTGDIAGMRRILELYRTNKAGIDQNPELMQNIKLTPGREVNTTEITKVLNKAFSGRQMKNAYNGGGFLKNLLGFGTMGLGYAFMPSLEKSRAQADGLNQMLSVINKALQSVLITIQTKETELSGMEKAGQVRFDKEGNLVYGTSAAKKTLADLEEEKVILDSIQADLLENDKIVKKTGGNFGLMIKYLNFASPALKECDGILRNLNSGFDKNGKALKFQNRLAEILNYTYQLMSRSIGQMFKNWMSMISPINVVKKAFTDFMNYNVKWQRTMNVIKYNLRAIGRTLMDDIAQKLVNIIGFFDIISMKIQSAFGKMPISLFDQAAANSEKIHEELEAGANVTAGFDELHDIGSDNTGANDLLGEIYKPKLSPEWKKLANDIGDLFAHVIKGDMGFGEVMATIIKLLGETLVLLAKTIWEWFKNTAIGKYLIEHWKDILGTILTIFLGWKLLKIAGKLLFDALFGNFTISGISGVFSKIGGWITKFLSGSIIGKGILNFGLGIKEGLVSVFTGKGGLISTLGSIFKGHEAITAFGAWGETLGALFIQGFGVALGGLMVGKGFSMVADNTSYNEALMSNGGKETDKKSNFFGKALGTIGGAVAGGFLIGGPIGAAIGAISGLLITSLAPAFEKATISAKNMNNEMQKIEYYEGAVQGAQSSVNIFTEQLNLLKQSLDLSTQSVYDQGEKLGITKTRMDELVTATQNGTFTTGMLTGAETALSGSLTDLAQKQEHTTEVSKKLEEAQKKLLKAQTELSIAQDIEAGNFEVAAARIEVAEMQGVYTTEDATAKRIQLYKQGSEEERKNLLQNLTADQRKKMLEYNAVTDSELKQLNTLWHNSSDEIKRIFTDSIDQETINEFNRRLNSIDSVMAEHTGFWQGVGDTIAEIFTLGHATTHTYNKEDAAYKEIAHRLNTGTISKDQVDESVLNELRRRKLIAFEVGTNYVPSTGLAYLHQGEAVIPKKYNKPYEPAGMSMEEQLYMKQMMNTMKSLDDTMKQGIPVSGQFVQRGSDLVAVVNKTKSQTGADLLSNVAYAR